MNFRMTSGVVQGVFFVIAVFSITVVPKVILTDQELCDSIDLQIYCCIDNPSFWEYIH
jgi:hypothetical protein